MPRTSSQFLLAFVISLACSGSLCIKANAQGPPVAGQNINMVSGTQWPGGDPFLQRQNEPSIAVSTRNPLHLLAGANDYRTVDLPLTDVIPGAPMWGDAWLGLFKSFDGGQTWQSTLLPGYPQDQSAEGKASPLKGLLAGSDPVVRAGTNGLFYYSGIAFNRGTDQGAVFVARLIDLNNKENGDATQNRDPIRYLGTVAVDRGNAGQFLDKPWIAVDIPRGGRSCMIQVPEPGAPGGTVTQTIPAGNVYLVYSIFVGNEINIRTKLYLSRSTDCGATWSNPIKLSEGLPINQGTIVQVDPTTGYVYVAWRAFATVNTPDAIYIVKSIDGGQTFTKAIQVVALPSFDPKNPTAPSFFDQGTTATTFRTQDFPAMAIDGSGRIYVAWSQRGVGPNGDARIVMKTSFDGYNWSPTFPVDNGAISDDYGSSFERGHQIMPQMTFTGGKLMVIYYDLRLDHTLGIFNPNDPFVAEPGTGKFYEERRDRLGEPDSAVFTDFVDDFGLTQRRHTIEVMVSQADPSYTPSFTTARVSQYKFGFRNDGTDLADSLQELQVNPPNLPMFRGGAAPFFGDYIDIAGLMFVPSGGSWIYNTAPSKAPVHYAIWTSNQDVRPPSDGDWTHYTPVGAGGQSVFDPTQPRPACVPGLNHEGMRNQNIYSSRITQGLLVSSPQNSKPLDATLQRAFVVLVQNATNFDKTFRLTIANQPAGGKASFCQYPPCLPSYADPLTTLDVHIGAHSGIARQAFATSTNPTASIIVNVAEIAQPGGDPVQDGLTSFAVLNADATVPPLINPDAAPGGTDIASVEIYSPNISNPNISNPNISNPSISNPNISNPNISNPNISNPNISNPDIANPNISNPNISNPNISNPNISNPNISNPNISNTPVSDATYVLTNKGNTAASYNVKLIGNAPANVPLQLIVTKPYLTPVAKDCQLMQETQNIVLANITNPNISNPEIEIPNISNPNISNPNISNTTLALAPGETVFLTLRGNNVTCCGTPAPPGGATMEEIVETVAPVAVAHAANTDDPTHTPQVAAPLFITTAALPDGITGNPYSMTLQAIGGVPPYAWSVVQGSLPMGLMLNPSTGAISGTPPTAGSYAFTVQVTDSASSTATRPFVIRIADPLVVTSTSLPGGVQGVSYGTDLSATGGIAPLTWSLVSGSLPVGLGLSSGGLISGTPTTVGPSNFTVQVVDSGSPGQIVTQALSISVAAPAFVLAPGELVVIDGAPNYTNPSGSVFGLSTDGTVFGTVATVSACPTSIAVQPSGNFLLTDPCSNPPKILRVTPGGTVSVFYSGPPLVAPIAVAVDSAGNVLVGDNNLDQLFKISPDGASATLFANLPHPSPVYAEDIAIAVDSMGNFIVGYDEAGVPYTTEILRITPGGSVTSVEFGSAIKGIGGLAIDVSGNYTVADFRQRAIFQVSPAGLIAAGPPAPADALCCNLVGLAIDSGGNFYSTLNFNKTVIKIAPDGTVTTLKSGSPLTFPNGVILYGATPVSPIPVPQIDQPLVPMSNIPGGPEFTLTVNGTGFVSGSVVKWNGSARSTNYVSSKQLTATIPASDIATAGTAWVTVVNPSGAASNVNFFQVTTPTPSVSLSRSNLGAAPQPTEVTQGDFNGDGKQDFAVVNWNCFGSGCPPNQVSVFLGNGDGTFQPRVDYAAGQQSLSITTGDFNGDGKLDLVVANNTDSTVSVYLGNGNGTFQPQQTFATGAGPYWVATADFNGDGKLDLTVADNDASLVSILLGNGDGTFQAHTDYATGSGPYGLTVGDFNGDGKLDLAVSNDYDFTVSILLGNGDGTFQPRVDYATGQHPFSVTAADFDGDGKLDLAVSNSNTATVSILLGNGDGTFQAKMDIDTRFAPGSLISGDFNGDGKLDLATGSYTTASILLGNGDGTFQPHIDFAFGSGADSVTAGDVNGDGRLDIATANHNDEFISVLLQTPIVSLSGTGLSFGDQAVGTTSAPQTVTLTNTGSAPLDIASIVASGDFAQTNTCTASVAPSASCLLTVTFTPTASGSRTGPITITDDAAGSPHIITLSGTGVLPPPGPVVGYLTFLVQPSNATGGQPISPAVQVRALDASQAALPSVSIVMSLGTNPTGGTLSGTTTAVTGGDGIATFSNLNIDRGGWGYTLVASSGAVTSSPSNAFNVVGFAPDGNMITPRSNFTATLLPNGQVLVAGGVTSGGGALTSAELYDPTTAVFSSAGNMTSAREFHTATLLPNGKVLIAGGFDGTNTLDSAEVYDPSGGGSFSSAGIMKAKRINHTATLLPDGTVLIAGGSDSPTTAELYDPVAGTFTFTAGAMGTARQDHTATLLPNGMVLLAGSALGSGASAELYNPTTKTFAATGSMASARLDHTATLLANGKVLIAGGFDGISTTLNTAEVFDPTGGGSFSPVGTMGTARRLHTATLLPNGKVLMSGGAPPATISAELYDPVAGIFASTGSLGTARLNHTATLIPNGKVIVSGGGAGAIVASAELFYPTDPPFAVAGFELTGSLNLVRYQYHTTTRLPNGKVLLAGGMSVESDYGSATAELYDPISKGFSITGSMGVRRGRHTATLLPDGKVLVAGGMNSTVLNSGLASAEVFDSASQSFTPVGNMTTARWGHTATRLPDGKVLITGGENQFFVHSSAELYDPATGMFTPTGNMNWRRIFHAAVLLPNGKVLVTGGMDTGSTANGGTTAELYDPATGIFTLTGSMGVVRVNHRLALLPNGKVLATGNSYGSFTLRAEIYDPETGTFSFTGDMVTQRWGHGVVVLPNAKVFVAGGDKTVEIYDPITGAFNPAESMFLMRINFTPVLLPDGTILLAGGAEYPSVELYKPGY